MTEKFDVIFEGVLEGNQQQVSEGVQAALDNNSAADEILNGALVPAMAKVGELFESGDYFVPEMLIAARAMSAGMDLIRPILVQNEVKMAGKVAIGTVQGDLHDIGKNLVGMMLEGAGFEIIDLGVDVSPESFVNAVKQEETNIVAMSALLTTTMASIPGVIQALEEAGLRERVIVMVGGAPVTNDFAEQVGADGFAADASQAARLAKTLVGVLRYE